MRTAHLLARALATPAESGEPADETQERILDAALELVAATGLRHLTMDDVAARAGVGRMTVYRRFNTRQTLVDELALREAQRCLARIAGSVNPDDRFEDRVADLFLATLQVISEHPLLARLARHEPQALLHELTRNDSEIFEQVRGFLVAQIRTAQAAGQVGDGDPLPLAELAIRLGASFVLIPGGVFASEPEPTVREAIRMALAPITSAPAGARQRS